MAVDLAFAYGILLSFRIGVLDWDGEWALLRRPGAVALRYRIALAGSVDGDAMIAAVNNFGTPLLVLAEHDSPRLRQMAAAREIALVVTSTRSCWINGRHWPERTKRVMKPNYRLWALARIMLATAMPYRQVVDRSTASAQPDASLSDLLEVGQSRVSTMMRKFPAGCVVRTSDGWIVADFTALWEWHERKYPGPGGIRTSWYSEKPPAEQMMTLEVALGVASAALDRERERKGPLASGAHASPAGVFEVADTGRGGPRPDAEGFGPAVLFGDHITSLMPAEYQVCAVQDATAQIVCPTDWTVWLTADAWGLPERTDPLLTSWELRQHPGNTLARLRLHSWAKESAPSRERFSPLD